MRQLKFDPELLNRFDAGVKTATTRMGEKVDLTLGWAEATFGDRGTRRIFITKIELLEFQSLHMTHAMLEGYESTSDLKRALKYYYPDIQPESVVTFIKWGGA